MISPRVQRYLQQLTRRPHVDDLGAVKAALEAEGAPATEALLTFHQRYAGYVTSAGADDFVWGLVHAEAKWWGPMQVDAYEEDGLWYVTCADAHPSYALTLDQHGVHYTTAGVPRATSIDRMMEQYALIHEFGGEAMKRGEVSYRRLDLVNDRDELQEVLLPRLAGRQVAEASDEHGAIYVTDELLLEHYVHFGFYAVRVVAGAEPAELAELRWKRDERRSLEQLRRDVTSRYSKRRYEAVMELRQRKEAGVGEILRLALRDDNEHAQRYAIDGLRELGHREAVPDILALMDEGAPIGVVNFAINAIKELDPRAAQPALIRATAHADQYVRRNAVVALHSVGDEAAIAALEARYDDAAVPMAGPRGDKLTIGDLARAAVEAIRERTRA